MGGGKYEITIYTSCCNADRGIYYYTTYGNHQITAVDMHAEDLESDGACEISAAGTQSRFAGRTRSRQ